MNGGQHLSPWRRGQAGGGHFAWCMFWVCCTFVCAVWERFYSQHTCPVTSKWLNTVVTNSTTSILPKAVGNARTSRMPCARHRGVVMRKTHTNIQTDGRETPKP